MRRLGLLTVLSLLFTAAFAQSNVNLELNNVPISEAIAQFSQVSGYRFAYNPDILQEEQLSASLEGVPLERSVKQVFGKNYDYKIRGSYIILLPKQTKATGNSQKSQPATIQGEIVEEGTNKKLENVSVYEIHTLKPVLTNSSGDYSIEVSLPKDVAFIAISKENYQDTIIQVNRNSNWSVKLKKKKDGLEKTVKESVFSTFFQNETMQTHTKNVNLTERRWAHLALTPGVSTNGFLSGKFTNKFSVNLLAGYSHALEGVEIGGFLNMERSYVEGVQISGAVNINGDYTDGVQMAGLSNVTIGWIKGLQIGGFSNHCGDLMGWQLAGAVNTSTNAKGTQLAGAINWNNNTFEGVQTSGFLNYAKTLNGVQIGVVNIADSVSKGFMIGIVNWTRNGIHHFEFSANDVTPYNIAFRSGVYPFYGILQAGINPHDANIWDRGMGFGTSPSIAKKASLDIEGTYHQIQPLDKGYIEGVNALMRLKVRFGYKFAKHVQVIGGPALNYFIYRPDNPEDLEFADRFGKNAFIESRSGSKVAKLWLGYEISVRF